MELRTDQLAFFGTDPLDLQKQFLLKKTMKNRGIEEHLLR